MATARSGGNAVLLTDGKVLALGGGSNTAEIYDPTTALWTATGSMTASRQNATGVMLPSGRVWVAGGQVGGASLATTEIYDPAAGTWSAGPTLGEARDSHTSTLLKTGKVLVAGGVRDASFVASAVLYDPVAGTLSPGGTLTTARGEHTAVLLQDGKVLACGGRGVGGALASCEIYDPMANVWTAAPSLATARYGHTATVLGNGAVLVVAGRGAAAIATVEILPPGATAWGATGSLATARFAHSATLLPWGGVAVIGGYSGTAAVATMELYNPATAVWTAQGILTTARYQHAATLLPGGGVLVAGGIATTPLSTAEILTPPAATLSSPWTTTGSMASMRADHTATLLENGKVLVAGGYWCDSNYYYYFPSVAELYDPTTGTWIATGSMVTARDGHAALMLGNGKVLVVGGAFFTSTELYDPATGTWTATGSIATGRDNFAAAVLANGKVLVAGGYNAINGSDICLSSAELYDPATGTWTATGAMTVGRKWHTATALANGKVLVAGGYHYDDAYRTHLSSAELYDPATATWTATGSMATARALHAAMLLRNGKVLVAGGHDTNWDALSSAELYDPTTGTWTATRSMTSVRDVPAATMLGNGKVLVVGGFDGKVGLSSAESYDPATGTWTAAGSMATARYWHQVVTLGNGKALVVGGAPRDLIYLSSAELYDPSDWRATVPTITASSFTASPGQTLSIAGTGFRGNSEGSSGGAQSCATDYPVAKHGASSPMRAFDFTDTQVKVTVPCSIAAGATTLTLTVNGVSVSRPLTIYTGGCLCAGQTCDDHNACTTGDVCDGVGGCAGIPVAGCSQDGAVPGADGGADGANDSQKADHVEAGATGDARDGKPGDKGGCGCRLGEVPGPVGFGWLAIAVAAAYCRRKRSRCSWRLRAPKTCCKRRS